MTKQNLHFFMLVLLSFSFYLCDAQEATTSSGGDASGAGGSVAYSLGQAAYTMNNGITGSVEQGVQQSFFTIVTGINDPGLDISLSVFPNPTVSNLVLLITNLENKNLSYQLSDIKGKILESKIISRSRTQINMNALPSAIYFLNIFQKNKKVQFYKIIKN
ncbi:MAG TPA: T9SS type A sorting domain-containing protein [Chitinophagaceae bacterium]|nr:T9SS type A sorting domain-containing protein [Chitinophagaceae bacterium]